MIAETELVYDSADETSYFVTTADVTALSDAIESGEKVLIHVLDPNLYVFTYCTEAYLPVDYYIPSHSDLEVRGTVVMTDPYFHVACPNVSINLRTDVLENGHLKIYVERTRRS